MFLLAVISIIILLLILTSKRISFIDFTNTGPIGDTIGGITSPFISLIGIVLTFLAFYVQYKANVQQKQQFDDELAKRDTENAQQDKSWQIERFENKFYTLLKLHKENVKEIKITGYDYTIKKRKAFVFMFHELKYTFYCYRTFYLILKNRGGKNIDYSDKQLLKLAYIFFYCGVGNNSDLVSRALNRNLKSPFDEKFFESTLKHLKRLKETSTGRQVYKDCDGNEVKYANSYKPRRGHQSLLGHYQRHQFQTVRFVVAQPGL